MAVSRREKRRRNLSQKHKLFVTDFSAADREVMANTVSTLLFHRRQGHSCYKMFGDRIK